MQTFAPDINLIMFDFLSKAGHKYLSLEENNLPTFTLSDTLSSNNSKPN